jgi:periplasmic divalent cation tolerance protein
MAEYIQVITTTGNKTDAEKIAEVLVEKKLAGCVQIFGPISSVYWWEGKMQRGKEWFCLIKTTRTMYENLESAIRKVHPYKVPEILAIPVVGGSKDYLCWLDSVLEITQQ